MKPVKKIVLTGIIFVVIAAVLFWVMLPPINLQAQSFYMWLFFSLLLTALLTGPFMRRDRQSRFDTQFDPRNPASFFASVFGSRQETMGKGRFRLSLMTLAGAVILIMLLCHVLSLDIFHAKTYANRIVPVDGEAADLPTSEDVDHISLMDTDSARILGNRVIGSLSDVVSQFEVSEDYNTLVRQDKVIKVVPLDYGGFFKFVNNYRNGTPGYVKVDTQSFDATFVRLEKGLRYTPNGYFFKNLARRVRLMHPTAIIDSARFEIDEDGNPYWVNTVYGRKFLFGGDVVKGAIVTDPYTGQSDYYKLADIPDWVDIVFTGNFTTTLYDSYGMLRNGWLNSVISQKGCLKTTDDFGYLAKGKDIYIYTGITSVAADQSNLGFIMVNARTGDCTYVACAGAEEYSAMSAAQGALQNYGYRASFPSLVTVDGVPTYVMVLKDTAGLIKDYAAVNVTNYTIVSTGASLDAALADYRNLLKRDNIAVEEDEENAVTADIVVDRLSLASTGGDTWAYLITADDTIYKIAVAADERVVALEAGDKVTVTYAAVRAEDEVIPLISLTIR